MQGGVEIMEITLRSDLAKDSLRAVRREFPELIIGAGSVINPEQIEWVKEEGLDFSVSPGWSDVLAKSKFPQLTLISRDYDTN